MTEILILKKRKDFVKVAKQGVKMVAPSLILQAAFSLPESQAKEGAAYLGYTVTKKIGKAHVRNRCKRRLRAAVHEVFAPIALSGVTYVLIGRHNTADVDFIQLKEDMLTALKRINKLLTKGKTSHEKESSPAVDSAD